MRTYGTSKTEIEIGRLDGVIKVDPVIGQLCDKAVVKG